MNIFAKFDEIPSMTLQDFKETKRYGHTFVRSVGQRENSIPSHKHSLRGGIMIQKQITLHLLSPSGRHRSRPLIRLSLISWKDTQESKALFRKAHYVIINQPNEKATCRDKFDIGNHI